MYRKRLNGMLFLATLLALPALGHAATINWSGTATGWYHQNTSAYFLPNTVGTTITGTLDISNLSVGDVEMFGLIDKRLYDTGGYMWQGGAYVYIHKNSATTMRIGVTDGNLGGEIISQWHTLTTMSVPFVFTVHDGLMSLTSDLFAGTLTRPYGIIKTLNNAYGYAWDEFQYGAYLGGSLYAGGPTGRSVTFDVSATNAIPEPAMLTLLALGALGVACRRRTAA
jgi:MYXO-CTERM domain-containing protein